MGGFAWVTLATNDSYSLGALVLAHSLRQVNTVHQLAVLVTPGVTPVMRAKLASVFNVVVEVNILDSKDEANLRLLKRPELGVTFTKLHCWRLTQFEKCVFLDADTMVLANADELFDKEEFSAAPDVGWPDCFNSGVFVYRPSEETYSNIVKFALERGSFDGGDQGLLNLYFSDWAHKDISKHLPFIYNTCSTACYSYLPAFKQFGGNVKIIHFIGSSKPWLQYFDSETRQVQVGSDLQHLRVVLQQWWNIFCSCIHPILSPEMAPSRVPAAIPLPFHSSMEQTVHHEFNPDSSYNKPTSKNVWDPWEEYEEKIDNFEIQSNTICVPNVHSENIDTSVHIASEIHDNNNIPTFQHSQETPESSHFLHHDTNTHMLHNVSHNQESHVDTFVNQPEFSFSNQSDHTPPPHPLHDSVHSHIEQSFQPPSPEPDICTSYTNVEPGTECTQHARPQSCESASSVTNESALHESNEVFDNSAGLAGAFARLTLGAPRTAEQAMLEDQLRRQGWEVGNIDYMGRDSFDNIWTKICETLNTAPAPPDQSQEPSHAVPSEAAKQATTADITPTPPPESVSKPEFTKPQSTQLSEVAATQSEQPAVIPLPKAPTEVPVAKSETVALQSKCGKTEDTEKPILPPTPISPISVCPVGAPSTPAPIPKQQIVSPPIALPDSPTVCELPKPAPSLMSELQKPTPPQAETQKTTVSAPIPPQPATAPHSVATSAPTPVTPKPIVPQAEAQKPTVDTSKAAPPTKPAEKQKAPDAPAPSAPKTVTQPPTTVPPQSVPQKPTVEASKPAPPAKHDEKAKAPSPSPPKIASEAPKAVTAPPAQKPTPAPTVDTSKPVPPAKSDDKEKAPAASPPSKAPSKTTAKPTPAKPADPAPAKPAEPTPAKPADPKPTTPPADAGPTPPPRKSTAGGGSAPKKPAAKGGKK